MKLSPCNQGPVEIPAEGTENYGFPFLPEEFEFERRGNDPLEII